NCVKTDGERKNAGKVADYFNRQYEPRKRPHRSQELLNVTMAMNAQPMIVVVDKSQKRTAQRDGWVGRGRLKSRNQSEQIAQQDEVAKDNGIRNVALITVSHHAMRLVGNKFFGGF